METCESRCITGKWDTSEKSIHAPSQCTHDLNPRDSLLAQCYLDLRLALFLLIAVFLGFTLVLTSYVHLRKKSHLCLDGRVFTFFSRIFTFISRENTLIILASKLMNCKNSKSGAIMFIWRKTAQKAEISQTSIYLCFFEDYRYLGICCQAQTLGWAVLITVLRNGYVAGLESADFSVFKTREGVLNPFTHRFRIRDSRTPDFGSDFRLFLFSINVRGISTTDGPAPHKACTG